MKKFFKTHKKQLGYSFIALTVAVNVTAAVLVYMAAHPSSAGANGQSQVSQAAIQDMAANVVDKCKTVSYKPTCYEEEVPKLMDTISMEQAFAVTIVIQQLDPSYAYCHVLGHKLAARETAKDPSKWKEVITRVPGGVCSNGGIHGAFQERFRAESLNDEQISALKPEISDVCEARANWNPTGLQQATCYHALGHLLMYITNADIFKASSLCDELAVKDGGHRDFTQVCYDGTFMQIYQPLEPEDFALVAGKSPTKETLPKYCAQFTGWKSASCWDEAWPLSRNEIMTPKGAVKYCSQMFLKDINYQNRCFDAMFYIVTAQVQFDVPTIQNFCNNMPKNRMGECFGNAATRFIETDYKNIPHSIELCSGVVDNSAKDRCYQELIKYSTYNFKAGSSEFYQLCENIPEPWKTQCLEKQNSPGFSQ